MCRSIFAILIIFQSSISLAQNRVEPSKFKVDEVRFTRACDSYSDKIVIAGVGDIMMHMPVQNRANRASSFKALWDPIMPTLQKADIIYGNLESPLAAGISKSLEIVSNPAEYASRNVYTGHPLFNASPQLALELMQSGFDVISTANNHALDRGSIGVDLTIETLKEVGIKFTGTRHSEEAEAPWYTIVDKRGWRIAFLACTFSTNGLPDRAKQVLDCFKDTDVILKTVNTLSQRNNIDAVIVTPHWGWTEYTHSPDAQNVQLGRKMIEAGAAAVIGTHPHVIQPWEKYRAQDGREGIIAYSTGNFVSNQSQQPRRLGMSVYVGLSRRPSGKAWVNGVRYHPVYMNRQPLQVESLSPNESEDIWKIVRNIYGHDRHWDGNSDLVTNPECYNKY